MKLSKRTEPHFRMTESGMLLIATRTAGHPQLQFPPLEFVHGDEPVEQVPIGPFGQLYTYTLVHPGKDSEPYALAMVDFEPGVRAFGRLICKDGKAPAIDSTMRIVPSELPDGSPDYAFEAVSGESA
ncbi:Zn-ribbon domain-containing OB-fold protein [Novosphingobium sp. B 225]|uniref:Zn-ribbon domain-containing OB-fold protein n=1 Tax=Novosphingobium sp. B 225 TaxID=1961849 RepID=UPI000B4B7714|nr:OB-fold domain-containing protein [Novosphingobium sp. B 225]